MAKPAPAHALEQAATDAFTIYIASALAAVGMANSDLIHATRMALRERRLYWAELHRAAAAARRSELEGRHGK